MVARGSTGAGDLHGALRRQAPCRRVERVDHVLAEDARRPLTPARTLGRPFGEPPEERLQIAHHLELRRHRRIGARRSG